MPVFIFIHNFLEEIAKIRIIGFFISIFLSKYFRSASIMMNRFILVCC
jgi:hypothetical protein